MAREKIAIKGKSVVASWSRGSSLVDTNGSRIKGIAPFEGFFCDTGIDLALDDAAQSAGWERGLVRHMGGDRSVEHWLIPTPALAFVLLQALPDVDSAAPIDTKVFGTVARAWNALANGGMRIRWPDGGRSSLGVQVVWADLLKQGYSAPMPISVKSNYSTDLLGALMAHEATLAAAEKAAAANGKPTDFTFWDIACAFIPGNSEVRGVGSTTSEVTPIRYDAPIAGNLDALRARHRIGFELQKGQLAAQVSASWGDIVRWASAVEIERV